MTGAPPLALPEPLETERLVLSRHRAEDFEECARLWSDPEVTHFIGGRPLSNEETWARLLRYAGLWALLGFGYWAVREKGTGRFVGDVGMADLQRLIEPSLCGAPEMGWVLAPWSHGRGFATEAVNAALSWADSHLSAPETVCIIVPENQRSIRVAERVGYRPREAAVYNGGKTTIFARFRRCSG